MSKYTTLIAQIAANIRRNGAQEITGDLLQEQLLAMITSLGEYYQFGGLASPSAAFTPGDEPVVFIAATPGTYTDFGGLVVADNEVALLVWSGSAWSKQTPDIATRSEVSQLGQEKVEKSIGKNLFNINDTNTLIGKYILSNGIISSSEYFNVSGFISIEASTGYYISADEDNPVYNTGDPVYFAFYDKDFALVSTVAKNKSITTPSGVSYMRITYRADKTKIMVNKGVSRGDYDSYNPIYGYLGDLIKTDESLEQGKVNIKIGKNLFNKDSNGIVSGYMTSTGAIGANDLFRVSDYIPVSPSTDYHISAQNDTPVYNTGDPVYYGFYDSSKELLSAIAKGENKTTPSGAYYMRITYRADKADIMVNKGSVRGDYEPYNEIGGYIPENWSIRKRMDIYKTDTEEQIVQKLINAFNGKDYDVFFESGTYNFSEAFDILATKGYARELPIGGNCRYYLNNSILIGTPYTETDIKVMGTQWSNQTFELYDGTLKCIGGSYCFHDESYGQQGYCRHLFHNIHFVYESGESTNQYRKCFGCGLGESSDIIIEGCIFETDFNGADSPDFGAHTASNQSLTHNVKFLISNCYFSRGLLVSSGGGAPGIGVYVQLSNCSYKELTQSTWTWLKFCNEVRS